MSVWHRLAGFDGDVYSVTMDYRTREKRRRDWRKVFAPLTRLLSRLKLPNSSTGVLLALAALPLVTSIYA
jgi:hypothetical protein